MDAAQIGHYIVFPIFFFIVGSVVGSFLNVVIWRLPNRGQEVTFGGRTGKLTLSWPPSHCPKCDAAIPFYQNVPIFGWLFLGGRCAKCSARIAIRYPLVELATGLLFVAIYACYFIGHWQAGLGSLDQDWPTLALHLFFVCCLLAASAIDADWFIIPLGIPLLLGLVALLTAPFITSSAIPSVDPRGMWALPAIGGVLGLAVANILVRAGVLPMSFAELLESEGDTGAPKLAPPPELTAKLPSIVTALVILAIVVLSWWLLWAQLAAIITLAGGVCVFLLGILPRDAGTIDVTDDVVAEINVPFARREMLKEILFLLLPLAGAFLGWISWHFVPTMLPDAAWMGRVCGVLLGLLAGGGLVWGIRVLGTLLFGKEAMGLGDVHLMAAVGMILGAPIVILAFFVAAFLGMFWGILLIILRKPNVLPFGPWLSMASIICVVAGAPMLAAYLDFIGR